jgi:hypothetical protein
MNSPFVVEQAKALAARPEMTAAATPAAKVTALYRLVLARPPRAEEAQAALRFLGAAHAAEGAQLSPGQQLAQVLLLTNEVMFVD